MNISVIFFIFYILFVMVFMVVLGVLASGSGSNFQSIIDNVKSGYIPDSSIGVLITDKKDAYARKRAKKAGIEDVYINPKEYKSRFDYDAGVAKVLKKCGVDIVCLAGYMRIVSDGLLSRFPNKVINIHPSLLPAFSGLHAQSQQLEYGVKIAGCTVHFVDVEVDHGPIIIQSAVPVLEADTLETLSKRILEQEHIIYPKAIRWFAIGHLNVVGRKVMVSKVRQAGLGLRVL